MRVWSAQPKTGGQALEEIDHRGLLESPTWDWFSWVQEKCWVQLAGTQLIRFADPKVGVEKDRIDLATASNLVQVDACTFQLDFVSKGERQTRKFRSIRTKEARACSVDEWVRTIQRAILSSKQAGEGRNLVLQMEIEASVPNASIDCLAAVDGHVWSASSDFRLRQWDIRKTAVDVGLREEQRELFVVRHLDLPIEEVEGRYRVITRMISPLGSSKQVWVAVGNRLAVVDFSRAPEVKQQPASNSAAAVKYLEPQHSEVIRSLVRTRVNGKMQVLSVARESKKVWVWDSEEKKRMDVQEPIPEGAGSTIECCVDTERFRWMVTDSHIVRLSVSSAKSAEVSKLAERSEMKPSMVIGSNGGAGWVTSDKFSCFR